MNSKWCDQNRKNMFKNMLNVPWFGCSVGLSFLGESVAKARTPGCSSESLSHLTLRRCRAGSPAYGDMRSPAKALGKCSRGASEKRHGRVPVRGPAMDRSGLPGPGRGPWEGAPVRTGPGPHSSPFQPHCPLKKKKKAMYGGDDSEVFFFLS